MARFFWFRYQTSLVLIAILLLAAGLRFWNIHHDSDLTATVSTDSRGKFEDIQQLATKGDIETKPGQRYQLYNQPLFLVRSYAAIWKAAAVVGVATSDQRMRVGLTAYMIVLSLGTVALVFLLGSVVLENRSQALFASLLFAVFPVNVLGTLYVKEDIPLMFWFVAAMTTMTALVHTGHKRWYLWSGPLIGLAIGSKYSGLLLLPIFGLAHLFVVLSSPKAAWLKALLAWRFFAAVGLAFVAFTLFNVQIITETADFIKGFLFQVRYANLGHRDGTVIRGIDYWWTFYLRYAIAPGITLPVTLFLLGGMVVAAIKRQRGMIFMSITVLLVYLQFENSPAKPFPFFARYLDMLYPLMAVLAAYALFALQRRWQHRADLRALGIIVGCALVLVPLGKSALIAGATRPDTRELAARWITANVPHGARIAMGSRPYSPQQLDKNDFNVNYDDSIHTRSVPRLRDATFSYVVVNSFQYDRYPYSVQSSATARTAAQGYAAFARELQLVQVVQPRFAFQTYGEHNPVIKIYKIP